jgi:thiol:disulfide interchange protein DsbD
VFILLALSMFGLFTLQLPSSLQTRLTLPAAQGGSPGGVFAMGAIAGLIWPLHYRAAKRHSAVYRPER